MESEIRSQLAKQFIEKFGSCQKAADILGLKADETVRLWQFRGIPLDRAADVERVTDGEITLEAIFNEQRAQSASEANEQRA